MYFFPSKSDGCFKVENFIHIYYDNGNLPRTVLPRNQIRGKNEWETLHNTLERVDAL
jgi:hypothetical protein